MMEVSTEELTSAAVKARLRRCLCPLRKATPDKARVLSHG